MNPTFELWKALENSIGFIKKSLPDFLIHDNLQITTQELNKTPHKVHP